MFPGTDDSTRNDSDPKDGSAVASSAESGGPSDASLFGEESAAPASPKCARCAEYEAGFWAREAMRAGELLTDALDFIADNEFTSTTRTGECSDCGAEIGRAHSEHCRWLALMRRAGRAR